MLCSVKVEGVAGVDTSYIQAVLVIAFARCQFHRVLRRVLKSCV